MDDISAARSSKLSERSLAVALITMARFIAGANPDFSRYLSGSLDNAIVAGLTEGDLAALRLVIKAIGGS